jgi:hypothetical protein
MTDQSTSIHVYVYVSVIAGKWRLVYSNSEMFRFYNGITGFANVFPGTSFQVRYHEAVCIYVTYDI